MRHKSLAQEIGCASIGGDIMFAAFPAPAVLSSIGTVREDEQQQRRFLRHVIQDTNDRLHELGKEQGLRMHVDTCKFLLAENKLHAERSCTQRAVQYLLPILWLPGGKELEAWWIQNNGTKDGETNGNGGLKDNKVQHRNRFKNRPPNQSFKLLKDALRTMESKRFVAVGESDRISTGRFGALGYKEKQPWHNFADPDLKGDASPNNEPVWRVVDRARVIDFWTDPQTGQVCLVIEIRGDELLPQQARRMVGTALAIAHGWLPANTMVETALRSDVFIETCLAPPGRLYASDNRFHFNEMRNEGAGFFNSDEEGHAEQSNDTETVHSLAMSEMIQAADTATTTATTAGPTEGSETLGSVTDTDWLTVTKEVTAPRIRASLDATCAEDKGSHDVYQQHKNTEDHSLTPLDGAPAAYQECLELLRHIVDQGEWPETSTARSAVIKEEGSSQGERVESASGRKNDRGSFSVVNPLFQKGVYQNGVAGGPLPRGNTLFPELVRAVFELERELLPNRPESSHCAINCRAQFTPHVDSGRGLGQSLSMIVGLGDYYGGELGIEGAEHDIRYRPLEFDGWKMRHWTKPFRGERFSLVWFTPDV